MKRDIKMERCSDVKGKMSSRYSVFVAAIVLLVALVLTGAA